MLQAEARGGELVDRRGRRALLGELNLRRTPAARAPGIDKHALPLKRARAARQRRREAHRLGALAPRAEAVFVGIAEDRHQIREPIRLRLTARAGWCSLRQSLALADGEKAIKELFGDAYDDKVKAIDDFITEHGGEEMQDYLFSSNRGNDPVFAKFMDKMVKLCSERGALPGEKGRDTRATGKLSPAEAEAQLRDFEKNNQAALADRTHPDHRALVDKRLELIEMANPAPVDG